MIFVQYFNRGCITGDLKEASGDRSVVVLDGRNSMSNWKADTVKFNGYRRPVYDAYQLFKGRNFLDAKQITDIILL